MPPTRATASERVGKLRDIRVDDIMPNEGNPRQTFEATAIERLSERRPYTFVAGCGPKLPS